MPEAANEPSLNSILQHLEKLIHEGFKHGFFKYTVACEIGNGGKRHLVIQGGHSHKFTIPKGEAPL